MVHRHLHPWSCSTTLKRPHLAEQVGAGQHGDHPREVFRGFDVETPDPGMGIRAAKEGGMQRAHHGDIIDVPPQSLNECWVFTTFDAITDQFWKHGGHSPLLWHYPCALCHGTGLGWRLGRHTATHRHTAWLFVFSLMKATIHQESAQGQRFSVFLCRMCEWSLDGGEVVTDNSVVAPLLAYVSLREVT